MHKSAEKCVTLALFKESILHKTRADTAQTQGGVTLLQNIIPKLSVFPWPGGQNISYELSIAVNKSFYIPRAMGEGRGRVKTIVDIVTHNVIILLQNITVAMDHYT